MNPHGQDVPKVEREQTILISHIILICWNAYHAWTSEK